MIEEEEGEEEEEEEEEEDWFDYNCDDDDCNEGGSAITFMKPTQSALSCLSFDCPVFGLSVKDEDDETGKGMTVVAAIEGGRTHLIEVRDEGGGRMDVRSIHVFECTEEREELMDVTFVSSTSIATAGRGGAIYIYDWVTLTCVKTLFAMVETTCCLSSSTICSLVAIEEEGKVWIVAGGYQGLRLWPLPWLERKKIE